MFYSAEYILNTARIIMSCVKMFFFFEKKSYVLISRIVVKIEM